MTWAGWRSTSPRASAALAAAGEVLVSGTVFGTVVGGPFEFDDRGFHELKGVPGRWPLFSLGAPPASAAEPGTEGEEEPAGPREPAETIS